MTSATPPMQSESFWTGSGGIEIILLSIGVVLTMIMIGVFVYVFTRGSEEQD